MKTVPEHPKQLPNYIMPDGCECDLLSWECDPPPKVCKKYKGTGLTVCADCGHNIGCHVPKKKKS